MERDSLGRDVDISEAYTLGDVTVYPDKFASADPALLKDADIVVVNKIPMNAETLAQADNLKLICLSATGMNNIDFDYVNSRGIQVKNVKDYSTNAVAMHTFAMLLYLYEHLSYYDDFVKSGAYAASAGFSHFERAYLELQDKTWGIIGMGAIGSRVAEIAKAFGCRVIYYSTSGANLDRPYEHVGLSELLKSSDVVSIHCPLNDKTGNLIAKDELAMMKKSAFLINVARGGIVNEDDLYDALVNHVIEGAGLDVLTEEPPSSDMKILSFKDSSRLIVTPHMGWGPLEARQRCFDGVCANIRDFLSSYKK